MRNKLLLGDQSGSRVTLMSISGAISTLNTQLRCDWLSLYEYERITESD